MKTNFSRISLLLVSILVVLFILSNQSIKATSSSCRSPSDTSSSSGKRGAAATLETELNELIEAELLNAHVTLAEQGLTEEDLEYFTQLTTEHVHNTLLFRRLFRRIGRIVRRIGRAIGRAFRAIGGIFRRRRAREIIMNSVKDFNGFTGPNREALELRRPFVGGGAQRTAAVAASAATTLGFFRRRRSHRRRAVLMPIVNNNRIVSTKPFRVPVSRPVSQPSFVARGRIGRIGRIGRRRVAAPANAPAAVGRSRRGRRTSIFTKIGKGIKGIAGRVKKAADKVKGSLKSKMEALEKSNANDGNHPVNCVACRVDCLKEYSTIDGSMFSSCGQRYYYYGCQAVKPCFQTSTASDDEIEGMIGICAYRNDCKFKGEWKAVSDNQLVADKLVGRIRGAGQNPE